MVFQLVLERDLSLILKMFVMESFHARKDLMIIMPLMLTQTVVFIDKILIKSLVWLNNSEIEEESSVIKVQDF